MLSPTAVALYTAGALWLALKYRVLLSGRARVIGELCTALAVAFGVVVVPYVPIGSTAWCPDVDIPTVPSIALVVGVIGPLLNSYVFPPVLAMVSALFTVAYLSRTECWGAATVIAGCGTVHAMLYIYDMIRPSQKQE